jgi:hypothetical protein
MMARDKFSSEALHATLPGAGRQTFSVSRGNVKGIIIGICFFAVGVGILCSGINNLIMANQAKTWPSAEGMIKSSKCVYYYVMNESSSYFTHVNYSYAVAGKSYQGDRIAFGYSGSWWRRPNQQIADRLSSAETVMVRYDPDKPSMAVLSCGLNGSTIMKLFTGGWLMLMTVVVLLHVFRSGSNTGMLALSWGLNSFRIIIREVGGIVVLFVTGLAIAWLMGSMVDFGILSTLITS